MYNTLRDERNTISLSHALRIMQFFFCYKHVPITLDEKKSNEFIVLVHLNEKYVVRERTVWIINRNVHALVMWQMVKKYKKKKNILSFILFDKSKITLQLVSATYICTLNRMPPQTETVK